MLSLESNRELIKIGLGKRFPSLDWDKNLDNTLSAAGIAGEGAEGHFMGRWVVGLVKLIDEYNCYKYYIYVHCTHITSNIRFHLMRHFPFYAQDNTFSPFYKFCTNRFNCHFSLSYSLSSYGYVSLKKVRSAQKRLHLFLWSRKNHWCDWVFARLGEAPGTKFDLLSRERDDDCTHPAFLHVEDQTVQLASLEDNGEFVCGIGIAVGKNIRR